MNFVTKVEGDGSVRLLLYRLRHCFIARKRLSLSLRHHIHLYLETPQRVVGAVKSLNLVTGAVYWAHNLLKLVERSELMKMASGDANQTLC